MSSYGSDSASERSVLHTSGAKACQESRSQRCSKSARAHHSAAERNADFNSSTPVLHKDLSVNYTRELVSSSINVASLQGN